MKLNVYPSPHAVAHALISHILRLMKEQPGKTFNIAFSGGSTPAVMFDLWAKEMSRETPWERMKIFWVDERCVSPENPESNYGLMRKLLLSAVPVPEENIFRIHGEEDPEKEAVRYSNEVKKQLTGTGKYPSFDIVLLGVGADGHTSSIFPGQEHLLSSSRVYEVSENPGNRQQRIALTGRPIIRSSRVIFLVTGKNKASVIYNIFTSGNVTPSSYIARHAGNVEFFADENAASELKNLKEYERYL